MTQATSGFRCLSPFCLKSSAAALFSKRSPEKNSEKMLSGFLACDVSVASASLYARDIYVPDRSDQPQVTLGVKAGFSDAAKEKRSAGMRKLDAEQSERITKKILLSG